MAVANSTSKLVIGSTTYTLDPDYLGGIAAEQYALDSDITQLRNEFNGKIAGGVRYKGSINYLPYTAEKGDLFVADTEMSFYIYSPEEREVHVEAGDMLICNGDYERDPDTYVNEDVSSYFDIIQGNIELEVLDDRYTDASSFLTHNHEVDVSPITYTPKGTVSQPTFSGTKESHSHTAKTATHAHTFSGTAATLTGSFSGSNTTFTGSHTPEGTVSTVSMTPSGTVTVEKKSGNTTITTDADGYTHFSNTPTADEKGSHTHTFSGSASYTPAGSVTVSSATPTSSAPANYTPAGTNSSAGGHTHTGKVSISYTPAGTIADSTTHTHSVSGSTKYTPAGTVSSHSHTIGKGTVAVAASGAIKSAVLTGSLDATTKTLTLSNTTTSAGTTTVINSVNASTGASTPTFSGTEATISISTTSGASGTHAHTFSGTAATLQDTTLEISTVADHTHTFSGTGTRLGAAFSGTAATISHSGNTGSAGSHSHTISANDYAFKLKFAGDNASVTPTFTGKSKTVSVSGTPKGSITINEYTPAGTVSNGAEMTVTVNATDVTPKGTVSKPTFTGESDILETGGVTNLLL